MKASIESYVRMLAGFGVLFGVGIGTLQLWRHMAGKLPETLGPSLPLIGGSSVLAAACAFFVFFSRLSLVWMILVAVLAWSGVAWCVTR
jgi:hypothetical protein